MIAKLTGTIDEILDDSVIINVNGVGYQVFVTSDLLHNCSIGDTASIKIIHIIKQDTQILCGFKTAEEISIFRSLLDVHGIGVKSALSILSTLSTSEIATAIASQDVAVLSNVAGIGKKTAERILLELKDKTIMAIKDAPMQNAENIHDAMLGLISLGYHKNKVQSVLQKVSKALGINASVNSLITQALKEIR